MLLTKCCIFNVRFESPNDSIVQEIRRVNQRPDTDYRYQRIEALDMQIKPAVLVKQHF
jgi:hypothetical protein